MEAIWINEVIDTEQPFEIRHRALLVHFHVSSFAVSSSSFV